MIDSVIDIVKAGAARGLPMAVASGGTRKHVMEGLTSTGLLPYFKVRHRPYVTCDAHNECRICAVASFTASGMDVRTFVHPATFCL